MIILFVNIYLCKSLLCICQKKKKAFASKSILCSSTITLCSFCVCGLIQFIASIMILNGSTDITTLYTISTLAGLLYTVGGHATMLFVFVLRIDIAFKNCFIAYSKCTIRTLYVLSISLYFITISLLIMELILKSYTYILGAMWLLLNISLCITLAALFIHKIKLIIKVESK